MLTHYCHHSRPSKSASNHLQEKKNDKFIAKAFSHWGIARENKNENPGSSPHNNPPKHTNLKPF